jgi:response regulator RpfG family c-di-GMP phosphodiesterase
MEHTTRPPLLCVDDEEAVLEGLTRLLRLRYRLTTAVGGPAGLEALHSKGPFAVVMSDMRMPGMNGVQFLSRVRAEAPDAVRVMLTGETDIAVAVDAVNKGQIFRFLSKPCPPETLLAVLEAAAEQHRLITAEKVLLERTLLGSIKALVDVLALSQPAAFGRASRAKQYAVEIANRLALRKRWHIEAAALLSQLACLNLPPDTLAKLCNGEELTEADAGMVERLPAVAAQIVGAIPRLEQVRDILLYQTKQFDGHGGPNDAVAGDQIPLGARILKVVLDYDGLLTRGQSAEEALGTMAARRGWYDPRVLQAFVEVRRLAARNLQVLQVGLRELQPGMVFYEDLRTVSGTVLIPRGQEMTSALAERIGNLRDSLRVVEPVKVVVPLTSTAAATSEVA